MTYNCVIEHVERKVLDKMKKKEKKAILFDKYRLIIPAKCKYFQDGLPGNRCFFIIASRDKFNLSFEEALQAMEIIPREDTAIVQRQFGEGNKRICFQRSNYPKTPCAYFSIELRGDDGQLWKLAGQMVVSAGYVWADDIEPVLLDVFKSLTLCNE